MDGLSNTHAIERCASNSSRLTCSLTAWKQARMTNTLASLTITLNLNRRGRTTFGCD
jgi:hypothetical protein